MKGNIRNTIIGALKKTKESFSNFYAMLLLQALAFPSENLHLVVLLLHFGRALLLLPVPNPIGPNCFQCVSVKFPFAISMFSISFALIYQRIQ